MFAYLRTGLAGLDGGECDELENYCFTWSIDARRWHSARDWGMHPDGYGGEYDDAARSRLERINALRRRAAAPLLAFESAARAASDARGQCEPCQRSFEDLDLAGELARRADELERSGRRQAAAEYARIWDAAVDALEQCSAVLGGMGLDAAAFARLYLLTLSQYGVGVIPVSLDMVIAGDMDRMRRRHIKHLIILGASTTACLLRRARAVCSPGRSAARLPSWAWSSTPGRPSYGASTRSYITASPCRGDPDHLPEHLGSGRAGALRELPHGGGPRASSGWRSSPWTAPGACWRARTPP